MFDFLSADRYSEFSKGSVAVSPDTYALDTLLEGGPDRWSRKFRAFKFLTDKVTALVAMPLIVVVGLVLCCLNPFFNRGPLFFSQARMGQNGKPFVMWKFRTMREAEENSRSANAPLEQERITRLGAFLRKTRVDELPNFFNVLMGHMSLVGPRPDAYNHADHFSSCVPGYRERYRVRPGITGLAQVEMGYAEGEEATALKAKYDNIYAARSCGRMDVCILLRTFGVVFQGLGR